MKHLSLLLTYCDSCILYEQNHNQVWELTHSLQMLSYCVALVVAVEAMLVVHQVVHQNSTSLLVVLEH